MHTQSITYSDKSSNQITYYHAKCEQTNKQPVVFIFPAMGVPAKKYNMFAESLTEKNMNVAYADLRGVGESSIRVKNKQDFGYKDILETELPEILQTIKQHFPDNPLFVAGHSLGGQLLTLFSANSKIKLDGLILLASGSNFFKAWPGFMGFQLYCFYNLAAIMVKVLGYFPGHKLGFGGTEAKSLILDWVHSGKTSFYKPKNTDVNYENKMSVYTQNVLAINFKDDIYSPMLSTKTLYSKYSNDSNIEHIEYIGTDLGLEKADHFNWMKNSETVSNKIALWISQMTKH